MNKCPVVAYLVLVLSATLLLGCAGITGEYRVVDLDQTLEGVVSIPKGYKVASLAEYKNIIADRYEDKTLQITNDEPHAFLVPVDLHGRVGGMIIGGWKRGKSKDSIVIYRWVSGSMYTSWGRRRCGLRPGIRTASPAAAISAAPGTGRSPGAKRPRPRAGPRPFARPPIPGPWNWPGAILASLSAFASGLKTTRLSQTDREPRKREPKQKGERADGPVCARLRGNCRLPDRI